VGEIDGRLIGPTDSRLLSDSARRPSSKLSEQILRQCSLRRARSSRRSAARTSPTTFVTVQTIIGGGAYWAGRAEARPLFGSCGSPLSLARPLFWVM